MKRSKIRLFSALSLIFTAVESVNAVDSLPGVDLWLPKRYQSHYLSLVEAAKLIQREPDCWQLLNGRLHEGKSTEASPIFYFRCRDANRKSYSYEVNMTTMNIVDSRAVREASLNIKRREKEAAAREMQRKLEKDHWEACHLAIKDKIRNFNKAKIVSELPPKGLFLDTETTQFKVNIDSLSNGNKTLMFSARCNIRNLEDIDVKVERRVKQ